MSVNNLRRTSDKLPHLPAADKSARAVRRPKMSVPNSPKSELPKIFACQSDSQKISKVSRGLTKKAEPPPTRDVSRDSGTASANGGWLRRLVRHQRREIHNKSRQIKTLTNLTAPHLLAASNRRELKPN
jgi:hypothetical protein